VSFEPGIVLEGGSIDVNAQDCWLTTEECLLSEKVADRNPGKTREELEQFFGPLSRNKRGPSGANGIAGDDTHGHIATWPVSLMSRLS